MNDSQIQICLQLLKNVPEEPDWIRLENAVMKSISITSGKTVPAWNRMFLPAALAGFCLVFWVILAAGASGTFRQKTAGPEQLTILCRQEERIVIEYPETAVLLRGMKPEKSGYDLYESMVKRYPFLKED